MSKRFYLLLAAALMLLASGTMAATTTTKVTGMVTITDATDYIISSATPFADDGLVDIVNTDHAVVILSAVKPSAAIKLLSKHVRINGAQAVNNTNCQVKLYNRGCIILPYGTSFKPLTVYSEPNFGGESVNNFGMESSGGFMNTLTEAKLNNRIQSFKLKRGYMVTFSTRPNGRGYSRCFIAADKDLEVAELPAILNNTISSYRIFRWYDTGKTGLANDTRADPVSKLNVTSCYSFGLGESRYPDAECVPHRIHEGWPSPAECGAVSYSPHLKTNNEPRNGGDDSPATLDQILANWEALMATGMRLCSPSSWDGSDYVANASGFLKEFFDSIDARGWRCDIIDLHCYWPEGSFGMLKNWVNAVHRPIWISEWVWGASWNNNGAFASGVTEAQNAAAVERICKNLNSYDYVERYYYWNSERDPSKIYKGDGKLTQAGNYYAGINSGLGYNGKYDYVPKTPKQYAPQNFEVTLEGKKATMKWRELNGEYNQTMEVQRKLEGGQWTTLAVIEQKEEAADYTYTDENATEDALYRVYIKDVNGRELFTNSDIEAGDVISVDGTTMYQGGNMIVNGDFDMGLTGWISGADAAISQPYFEVITKGSIDGGNFLQAYNSVNNNQPGSIRTVIDIKPNTTYFFRIASRYASQDYCKVSLTDDGKTESQIVGKLANNSDWQLHSTTFNSGKYSKLLISFRWLNKAQFDKAELRELFATYDEALADGAAKAQTAEQAAEEWAAQHPDLETPARAAKTAEVLTALGLPADAEITYQKAAQQPSSPKLNNTTGWETKVGTYKGGDQRTNTAGGKTCWNAWWGGLDAATGTKNTMEIRQRVTGLQEGVYVMACKATTEHYCLSDQRGYMVMDGDTAFTAYLKADFFDVPGIGDIWEELITTPIYVPQDSSVTIGFVSSKQGAVNNAWHQVGNFSASDKREGWWCATDFELRYYPAYKKQATVNQWYTICLPYQFNIPQGMKVYELAGLVKDKNEIALREVFETQAGAPYLFTTLTPEYILTTQGAAATSAQKVNGLRGFFVTSVKAPLKSYLLKDNAWHQVTSERPAVENYTALIQKAEDLTVLDEWNGITIPIAVADKIAGTEYEGAQSTKVFTLDGAAAQPRKGIYLEQKQGKTQKILKRNTQR